MSAGSGHAMQAILKDADAANAESREFVTECACPSGNRWIDRDIEYGTGCVRNCLHAVPKGFGMLIFRNWRLVFSKEFLKKTWKHNLYWLIAYNAMGLALLFSMRWYANHIGFELFSLAEAIVLGLAIGMVLFLHGFIPFVRGWIDHVSKRG